MSTVRVKNSKKSNNSKKLKSIKNNKLTKEKIPFGKSHVDYLPEGVLHNVYYFKHQLEFKPTLDVIAKLRLAVDSEIVETRIPIKKLLEKATNRKQIYIDVMPFNTPKNDDNPSKIQQEF